MKNEEQEEKFAYELHRPSRLLRSRSTAELQTNHALYSVAF